MGTINDSKNGAASMRATILQISNAQKKFGVSSLFLGGAVANGQGLTVNNLINTVIGTQDFTVEFFIYYVATIAGNCGLIDFRNESAGNGNYVTVYANSGSTTISLMINSSNILTSPAIGVGVWKHVAFSRVGGTLYGFVDGVQFASVANSTNLLNSNSCPYIGSFPPSFFCANAYMDEFRFTLGVGRYNANFTPPSVAFDDTDPNWVSVKSLLHFDDAVDTSNSALPDSLDLTNFEHLTPQPFTTPRRLVGTVKENGVAVGAGKRVVAMTRGTMEYIGSCVTKADGSFEMAMLADRTGLTDKLFVVAFDDDGVNPNYNAVIADQIEQEV